MLCLDPMAGFSFCCTLSTYYYIKISKNSKIMLNSRNLRGGDSLLHQVNNVLGDISVFNNETGS